MVYSGKSQCDAQSRQIPLWKGLNLQALWCSTLPTASLALYLLFLALLFSMFSPPLRVHCSLSLLVAWTSLNSPLVRLSLFMALTIRSLCMFGSSPACVVLVLQLRLEFPIRRQHEHSRSGHVSPSEQRQPARRFISSVMSWICSFSTVVVKRIPNPFKL